MGSKVFKIDPLPTEQTISFGFTSKGVQMENKGREEVLVKFKEPGGSYSSNSFVLSQKINPFYFPIETDEIKVLNTESKAEITVIE
jgi:hypothetical protein